MMDDDQRSLVHDIDVSLATVTVVVIVSQVLTTPSVKSMMMVD